jgi:hypothetical protein
MSGSGEKLYDSHFFVSRQADVLRSATRIVELLLGSMSITSVVDIGCANGVWLSVFEKMGVPDSIGVDGPWVRSEDLLIPDSRFRRCNLSKDFPAFERTFDLAVSIEVAEHLPADRADSFVAGIAQLSDRVLFSAAIPDQGGTGHINEQWQAFWARKFLDLGYEAYDIIRPEVWRDPDVNIIHAQNVILYSKLGPDFVGAERTPVPVDRYHYLDVVHPDSASSRAVPEQAIFPTPEAADWEGVLQKLTARVSSRPIVVYTCMVGRYDYILPPKPRRSSVRYVAFVDRRVPLLQGWDQRPLSDEAKLLPDNLKNRYHKLFPHLLFPESEWTVYVDSNIRILGDLSELVDQIATIGADMACAPHPSGRTLQQEVDACIAQSKANEADLRYQVEAYYGQGINPSAPISENNVVIRRTRSEAVISGMEMWWSELNTRTPRDQISLPYVIDQTGIPFSMLPVHTREPNPWYARYDHRKSGIRGLWQYIRIRRSDRWWWRLAYSVGRFLTSRRGE